MKEQQKEQPAELTQAEKVLEPVLLGMAAVWLVVMFLWIVVLA